MLAVMQAWMGLLAVWLGACGFRSEAASTHDAADAPATCEDLACGPNAMCTVAGTAACRCNPGFTGDGTTCHDIDECAAGTSGCAAACLNTTGRFACYTPRSCADIKAKIPDASDGTYTLYLDGDAGKPWDAYCAGMADTPREYLTLTGMNLAQYTTGGRAGGSNVTTTYSKVRFVATSHRIDIADRAFATLAGKLSHPDNRGVIQVTSMPYAVAMDCAAGIGSSSKSHTGVAWIDLTGTHFALIGDQQFAPQGNNEAGTAELSHSNQQVKLTGGGNCGWMAPVGVPSNPFNDNVRNGALLELVYLP